jgi:very-short-patch-repair endonuclease
MRDKPARRERVVAEIAARQHGVVLRAQLLDSGVTRSAISRWMQAGRLHRIHRGVYAVGHARVTFEGRCTAAFLACCSDPAAAEGPDAAVSHFSAAALWRLIPPGDAAIHVSLLSAHGRERRSGIVIHRPPSLCSADLTRRAGIWVTKPARTLRDLARAGSPAVHQQATRRALDLRLVPAYELGPDADLTRSELERMFLRLCRRHRLPRPEVNSRVAVPRAAGLPSSYEVDFLWREARLVAETDGFEHHGHRAAFEEDRVRAARLQAAGYTVLRFSYRQVSGGPGAVAAALNAALGRR